jgi:hypothetical protein
VTRVLHYDDGDGRSDQTMTIPSPIFHVLGLLSDLNDRYWVLPEQQVGGHVAGGFASRDEGAVRVVLYTHHAQDTQSRSEAAFDVTLEIEGLAGNGPVRVQEYRFDRENNSYFRQGRTLRDRAPQAGKADPGRLAAAIQAMEGDNPGAQREALATLKTLGASAAPALAAVMRLAERTRDDAIRTAAQAAIQSIFAVPPYSRAEVEDVRNRAECRPTTSATRPREPGGRLRLTARVAANGLNILVITPDSGH